MTKLGKAFLEVGILEGQGGQEMGDIRKRNDGASKARVALLTIRGEQTTAEIASRYSIHRNQVTLWKKQALDALPRIFSEKRKKKEEVDENHGNLPQAQTERSKPPAGGVSLSVAGTLDYAP